MSPITLSASHPVADIGIVRCVSLTVAKAAIAKANNTMAVPMGAMACHEVPVMQVCDAIRLQEPRNGVARCQNLKCRGATEPECASGIAEATFSAI
jgi:hypothetical protein